jgi:hypothetical protein
MTHTLLIVLLADLGQVVDKESALLNLPNEKPFLVDANHRTMCKIPSAESQEFEAVGAWIEDLVRSVATSTSPNLRTSLSKHNPRFLMSNNTISTSTILFRSSQSPSSPLLWAKRYHKQNRPSSLPGSGPTCCSTSRYRRPRQESSGDGILSSKEGWPIPRHFLDRCNKRKLRNKCFYLHFWPHQYRNRSTA